MLRLRRVSCTGAVAAVVGRVPAVSWDEPLDNEGKKNRRKILGIHKITKQNTGESKFRMITGKHQSRVDSFLTFICLAAVFMFCNVD